MTTDTDIAVIGGGLVGATLAHALGKTGYSITLLEADTYDPRNVPEVLDERSIVLSHGSRVLLELLGLWQKIAPLVEPIRHIHVSEQGRLGVTRLSAESENLDALGYVIRNSLYLEQIYHQLSLATDNLQLRAPAKLLGLQQNSDGVSLQVSEGGGEGSDLNCRLLIACDGTQSAVASELGIKPSVSDYDQVAVIANVRCEREHRFTAYERFTAEGPLALLPLQQQLMAMVYTVDAESRQAVCEQDDASMLEALQKRFGYRLGYFTAIGKRFAFPLRLVQRQQQVEGRVVLLGNAARTLHPVSGQGFNLAMRDMAALLEPLTAGVAETDPGSASVLQAFAQQRRRDQRAVVDFTDTLVRVFRGESPGFSHLRAGGLLLLQELPYLKHRLARQSMGMAGRLPDLRGIG